MKHNGFLTFLFFTMRYFYIYIILSCVKYSCAEPSDWLIILQALFMFMYIILKKDLNINVHSVEKFLQNNLSDVMAKNILQPSLANYVTQFVLPNSFWAVSKISDSVCPDCSRIGFQTSEYWNTSECGCHVSSAFFAVGLGAINSTNCSPGSRKTGQL